MSSRRDLVVGSIVVVLTGGAAAAAPAHKVTEAAVDENNRGVYEINAKNLSKALDHFSSAIKLDPDYELAWVNRGTTKQMQGDLKGAFDDWSQAIRLDTNDVEAYCFRAKVAESLGDYRTSISDLTALMRCDPTGEAMYYHERARLRKKLGDEVGAHKDAREEKLLQAQPNDR